MVNVKSHSGATAMQLCPYVMLYPTELGSLDKRSLCTGYMGANPLR